MLSKKCQYALHALLYLTEYDKDSYCTIGEIAEARSIPKKFLESILLDLKKAKVLGSKNGKGGGYFLRKKPEEISILEVVRLVDGAVAMLPCVSLNFYESCGLCDNEKTCRINKLFGVVRDETLKILTNNTLDSLVRNKIAQKPVFGQK